MSETPVGLSERTVMIVIGLVGAIFLAAVIAFALWITVTDGEPIPAETPVSAQDIAKEN